MSSPNRVAERIRVAPVLVNAHRRDITPRVYCLRHSAVRSALARVATPTWSLSGRSQSSEDDGNE